MLSPEPLVLKRPRRSGGSLAAAAGRRLEVRAGQSPPERATVWFAKEVHRSYIRNGAVSWYAVALSRHYAHERSSLGLPWFELIRLRRPA